MDNKNCKPCYGISCPHWPTCFPEMRSDIKELDGKIDQLQSENKRLKDVLYKYMKINRKIASKIWDTKTSVSMHAMLAEMEKEVDRALQEKPK